MLHDGSEMYFDSMPSAVLGSANCDHPQTAMPGGHVNGEQNGPGKSLTTVRDFVRPSSLSRHRRGVSGGVVAAVVIIVAAVAVVGGLYETGLLKFGGSKGTIASAGQWEASYAVNYWAIERDGNTESDGDSFSSYNPFVLTISSSGGISGSFNATIDYAPIQTGVYDSQWFNCSGWFDYNGSVSVTGNILSNGTASVEVSRGDFVLVDSGGTVSTTTGDYVSGCQPASQVTPGSQIVSGWFREPEMFVPIVNGTAGSSYSMIDCISSSCGGGVTFTIDGELSALSKNGTDNSGTVTPPVIISSPPNSQLNLSTGSSILLASGSEIDWKAVGAYYLEKGAAFFKVLEEDLASKLIDDGDGCPPDDYSCWSGSVNAVRGAEFFVGTQSDGNLTVTCYEGIVQVIDLATGGNVLLSGTPGVQAQQVTLSLAGNETQIAMSTSIVNSTNTTPPTLAPRGTLHASAESALQLAALESNSRYD